MIMENSLKFCKKIASDSRRSSFSDRDWDKAVEINAEKYFKSVLDKCRNWSLKLQNADGISEEIKINLEINPDGNFDYFTSSSLIHDGTLLFEEECIIDCIYNVVYGRTYNKKIGKPRNGNTINYIVGNLVVLNEHDIYGNIFTPKDKPYMCERTTVLLPIKMTMKC